AKETLERKLSQAQSQNIAGQQIQARADTLYWIESEFSFDGKLVKGSPYSAEAVTERTQTLSDGNRIVNKSSTMIYRDSEGRTRREQSMNFLFNGANQDMKAIVINDPVAGVTYNLDTEHHIARKNKIFRFEMATPPPASVNGEAPRVTTYSAAGTTATSTSTNANEGSGGFVVSNAGSAAVAGGDFRTFSFKLEGDDKNTVKESLGTQTIEGVDAEGTRTTTTIPAGTIGNERPIAIVDERWYSPALQVVVMTRHSDPRSGENTYRLTNINRTEPA